MLLAAFMAAGTVAGTAHATTIGVNGTPILQTDYETGAVGDTTSQWSLNDNGHTLSDDPMPGAYSGSQYSRGMLEDTNSITHEFTSELGDTVTLDTMVYNTSGEPGHLYNQMVWYNTSGIIGGVSDSPLHTAWWYNDDGDATFQYYDGGAYVDTGLVFESDAWSRLQIEYTSSTTGDFPTWTVDINGQSTTINDLNINNIDTLTNQEIGAIQFFNVMTIGGPEQPILLDSFETFGDPPSTVIPEPASLSLLGLGGLAMLRRRNRK